MMRSEGLVFLVIALFVVVSLAFERDYYSEVEIAQRGPRAVREARKNSDEGGWWKNRCCGDLSVYNPEFIADKIKKINACHEETSKKNITEVNVDPFMESFSCEKAEEKKAKSECNVDCVYQKYGIVDNAGNINIKKLKELYDWFIIADWRKQLAYKAADKCGNLKGPGSHKSVCSPIALNLKHCLWKEIIVTCPAEHQLKSEYCDRTRNFFKTH